MSEKNIEPVRIYNLSKDEHDPRDLYYTKETFASKFIKQRRKPYQNEQMLINNHIDNIDYQTSLVVSLVIIRT